MAAAKPMLVRDSIRRLVRREPPGYCTLLPCFCFSFSFLVFAVLFAFFFPNDIFYLSSSNSSSSKPSSHPPILHHVAPLGLLSPTLTVDFKGTVAKAHHEMDTEEKELILRQAASASPDTGGCSKKKVAFMFLVKGRLPLRALWERFFKGNDHGLFSIYLHTSPSYKEEPPESSVFFKRRIPSKPAVWGTATIVDAERRLIANALVYDRCNERFVLLSESCIPLYNFTTIYNYLINSNQSNIDSFDEPGPDARDRYNPRMSPTIALRDWRKGSQWFEVQRKLAVAIVSDDKYYPVFKRYCLPRCYTDEHYMATLVAKLFPGMNSGRSITWDFWVGGAHPLTFRGRNVSEWFLREVRRDEGCKYNGEDTSVCFLFARKFDGSTLGPLLRLAPKFLGFNPK